MAFVIRSERDIQFASSNAENPGPGEYSNSSHKPLLKRNNITSTNSIPFNSSSNRTDLVPKSNNPGPGAYLGSLNSFTLPNEVKRTLEDHQSSPIGFLASSKRFTEPNQTALKLPQASTKASDGLSLHISTSSKGLEDSQGHIIKPGSNCKALSPSRVVSIPSKVMFGYDFTKEGNVYLVRDPDSAIKLSGEKDNSAGPGHYQIDSKWTRNIVKWDRPDSNNKMKGLPSNSISTFLPTELISRDDTRTQCSDKRQLKCNKQQSTANHLQERRNYFLELHMKNKANPVTELMKEKVYENTPGPGFYTKEFEALNLNRTNPRALFGGTSERFKTTAKDSTSNEVGPGCYFDDSGKLDKLDKVAKTRHMHTTAHSKDNDCVYLRKLQKKPLKGLLGPGSYALNDYYIKKEVSKITNFGSIASRFNDKTKQDANMPDPGSYFQQSNFKLQKQTESNKDCDAKQKGASERVRKLNEQCPPVGAYNPGVISSIEYGVQSKLNPYQSQIASFNSTDKRIRLYDNAKSKLGPGLYSMGSSCHKSDKIKQSFSPFNQKDVRFKDNQNENLKTALGPGEYIKSSQFDWKKKSFNVLFV